MQWKELDVWKKAHGLVLEVYRWAAKFPDHEKYGLAGQLRRAAFSVPANIVEGQSRNTTREYVSFLYNARGSVEEMRYFLLLSKELNYLPAEGYRRLETECEAISKMLNGLIKSLRSKE